MIRLLSSPTEVAGALLESAAWSKEFDFCTPAVDSRLGKWSVWVGLVAGRVRQAFVGLDGLRSEPHALEQLHQKGVLRLVPAADGSFRSHLFLFRRGNQVRVITGAGALIPDGVMAPLEAVTVWEGGDLETYAVEAERLLTRAAQLAHVPEPEELQKYSTMFFEAMPHRDALVGIGAPLIRRTAFDGELIELAVVDGARQVREAMETMKDQLSAAATLTARQTLGFHGGNFVASLQWSSALGIWSYFKKAEEDYGNYFGVERPGTAKALQITVQANVPVEGIDRKRGGAVAREPRSGNLFLVHRGRIGGGQKGVGADLFWSRFRGGVAMGEPNRDDPARVVIVGAIGETSFPRDLAAFVHEVGRIKRAA